MTVSSISTGQVIVASDALILGKSKIITASRAATTASGDVAYTGVGFQPRTVIALGIRGTDPTTWGGGIGFADQNLAEQDIYFSENSSVGALDRVYTEAYLISFHHSDITSFNQLATLKSFDTDGFTLNWEKGGDGFGGDFIALCLG